MNDVVTREAAPAAADRRRRRTRGSLALRAWQLAVLLGLLGAWELTVRLHLIDSVIARSPQQVLEYLQSAWESGDLQTNTIATMEAVLISFVLASVVGVVAGVALGLLPQVDRVLAPFLDAANAMPRIALAPVFVVWLGIGMPAKIAVAFSVVVFTVMFNANAGVRSADPEVLRMSTVLGVTKPQLFFKVLLPVSVPAIFTGLRLGLVYALLGVVGSELISAQDGLGQVIAVQSATFQMQAVYGILLVLAVIAAILNLIMAALERRLLRWQPR
ncbi:ABC transporter permease [Amycolatopsis jejuensis]|uniref:ABC transporter permease n=1 Tax=Amycolatopsis jejuensis TaxID=330084 RepID=UPI000A029154|nr:ABC transporter permease [Amycolatopsis jejuensis]